jgi:MFS family permease
MIRAASPPPRPPRPCRSSQPSTVAETPPAAARVAYGRAFWLAYASNSLLMVAVSLLFRYADFINLLGGTEFHLGWIVGVGMVGSLVTRIALGSCIDTYGSKVVWLGSTVLFVATCFAHLLVTSHTGVGIYALRVLYCCSIAGVYGASMTFVSGRGPTDRMAEMIGMLGTAGFLGTVAGTVLGDYMLNSVQADRDQIVTMFVAAGVLASLSYPFAWLATRTEVRPKPSPHASLIDVVRRHHPGAVLVVGAATGVGLGLPGVFLRPYAATLDIPRIGLFFMVYAVAAIITRVLTRHWPQRYGTRLIIVVGMVGMAASVALFLLVRSEWQLIWPAIAFGFSHAIVFPSVVAAGSATFPLRHRGLATLLTLAAFDIGQLTGAPMAGAVLAYSPSAGLDPYPTMFLAMAGLLALIGVWYAIASRRQ